MSRSYKKNPTVSRITKNSKKEANRRCRRCSEGNKGAMTSSSKGLYKKYVNSYNIKYYILTLSYNNFLNLFHLNNNKENYRYWLKLYKAK